MNSDRNIAIKGADKEPAVVVWNIKKAEKQLGDSGVPDYPDLPISTIHKTIKKSEEVEIWKEKLLIFLS